MRFMIVVVVLASVGCKKAGEKTAASPCASAVNRGVDQTIAKRRGSDAPAMTAEEAAVPAKLKVALEKACVDTKWSSAVLDCFNTAPDIATCKEQLTPEQRGAYTQAAMSVMASTRGAGGPPAHGMPPGGAAPAGSGSAASGGPAAVDGSGAPPAGSGSAAPN